MTEPVPRLLDFDSLVLDCDGVVYVGDRAVDGTADLVDHARRHGIQVLFLTNDGTRQPQELAVRIREAGVETSPEWVIPAGQAVANRLQEDGHEQVLVLGSDGLVSTLRKAGLAARGVRQLSAAPGFAADAFALGIAEDLVLDDFNATLRAWRPGIPIYCVSNDRTVPTPQGLKLGCGAVAAALGHALHTDPIVCGKPQPDLFRLAQARLPAGKVLMVGDSLESDVIGARRAGWTGVLLTRSGEVPGPTGGCATISDPRELVD